MKPPALARLLLFAVAGESESEYVAGDLHEEFIYLCATRGRSAGSRWYVWQVLRSVLALLALRLRSGETRHVIVAVLGVAVPLLLLDRLWCFVHSQIPLKDGLERAPGFLAVNLVYVCVFAALCGASARSFHRAILTGLSAAGPLHMDGWCS